MARLYRWAAGLLALLLIGGGLVLGDAYPLGALPQDANEAVTSFPHEQVFTVSIEMADEGLENLLANAMEEKEHHASVTWNGQQFPHVSIRAKGNSSLMSVARSDSQRYSFKLDLAAYMPGQSLSGIEVVNLNNNFSDPTYLREYLSYEAFASMGVPTPVMTWVNLTLNGKPWGLYLAIEQIDKPYVVRHFGTGSGDLYKPDGQMGQGADLKWYGEVYDAYPGIVYKTKGKNATHQPLLRMLDALNNGGDLERHIDVDGVLRYVAVSTALVNMDSYQGPLAHNYYLYEQNGRFTVLPWDLNMSFAGFGMGGAQTADLKIDEPTSGALADRPLIAKLLEVPAYRERYHGYLQELIDGYLEPDRFEARAREIAALIGPYVKDDPTKFYTYEEFQRSLEEGITGSGAGLFGGQVRAQADLPDRPAHGVPGQMQGERGQPPGMAEGADAGRGRQAVGAPQGAPATEGQQRNVMGMAGGSSVGLLPFVRERVENLQQQLDGCLPTTGGGGLNMFGERMMIGAGPGGAPGGGAVPRGVPRPEGFEIPEGVQIPQGFEMPEGVQIPEGFQPPGGFRPQQGARQGGPMRAGFPGGPGVAPPTVAGVPADQVVPIAGALGLLLSGALLLWRLRPRL